MYLNCVLNCMVPPFNSSAFIPKTDARKDSGSCCGLAYGTRTWSFSRDSYEENGEDGEYDNRPPLKDCLICPLDGCFGLDDSSLLLFHVEQLP